VIDAWITSADRRVFDLQPDGPDELERLVHDLVGHLRFADDVIQQRLRVGRLGHRRLALEETGHDLDARQRVLHFVAMAAAISPERHEAVAQPFAFLELLDLGQVLEEQRDAGRASALVADVRERVSDHLARRLQAQFGAIGQMAQLERAVQHPHDVGMFGQHDRKVAPDRALRPLELEESAGLRR
jgi:hypothetical protein